MEPLDNFLDLINKKRSGEVCVTIKAHKRKVRGIVIDIPEHDRCITSTKPIRESLERKDDLTPKLRANLKKEVEKQTQKGSDEYLINEVKKRISSLDDVVDLESHEIFADINRVMIASDVIALEDNSQGIKIDHSKFEEIEGTNKDGSTFTVTKPNIIKYEKDVAGKRLIWTISDKLGTGDSTDIVTGDKIDNLHGGARYNLGHHKGFAWANIGKNFAEEQYEQAVAIAKRFPNEHKDGFVNLAVVKMGDDSIDSNEAMYRVLSKRLENKTTKSQRKKGYKYLEELTKDKGRLSDLKDYILSKKGEKEPLLAVLNDVTELPLGVRKPIGDSIFIGKSLSFEPNNSSTSTKLAGAMYGKASKEEARLFNRSNISMSIQEDGIVDVPQRHMFALQGVQVYKMDDQGNVQKDKNGDPVFLTMEESVLKTDHPNYPWGVKGKHIGILDESKHISAIMPQVLVNQYFHGTTESVKTFASIEQNSNSTTTLPIVKAFSGKIAKENASDLDLITSYMNLHFPNVAIVENSAEWANIRLKFDTSAFIDGAEAEGYFVDGKNIFINPNIGDKKVKIRGFAHMWVNHLESSNHKLYRKGIELMDNTIYAERAKNSLPVKHQKTENIREEALAIAIADGMISLEKASKEAGGDFMGNMSTFVREVFPNSFEDKDDFLEKEMSINDFVTLGIGDLLSGQTSLSDRKETRAQLDDESVEILRNRFEKYLNKESEVFNTLTENSIGEPEIKSLKRIDSADGLLQSDEYLKNAFTAHKEDFDERSYGNTKADRENPIEPFSELSDEENILIAMYTGSMSDLNSNIKANRASSGDLYFATKFDQIIGKVSGHNSKTVYRGISAQDNTIRQFKASVGGIYKNKTFMSTSKSEKIAKDFGPIIFEIETKGQDSASADIEKMSNFEKEKEVIYPRGSSWRIISVLEKDKNGITKIKLKEI